MFSADVNDIEVRLVDGLYPGDGYVQTRCPNSTWGTVCTDHWDLRDANVVCRQLGLPYAYESEAKGLGSSTDLGDVVVSNVYCTGEEETFGECRLENNGPACSGSGPGIRCSECKLNYYHCHHRFHHHRHHCHRRHCRHHHHR